MSNPPLSDQRVTFPWPCPNCGIGHNNERIYYAAPDWYVCECGGDKIPREDVPALHERWAALSVAFDETGRDDNA